MDLFQPSPPNPQFQLSGLNQLGIPIVHTLLEAKVEVATPKFQVARSVFGAMTYSANGPWNKFELDFS